MTTNSFYNPSGTPATSASGASAPMRAEFTAIAAGFALMPTLSGNGGLAVIVNAGGTALTTTTGQLALAGNFATTGAFNTTLAQTASVTLTLPAVSGTLATLAGTESLSNKTLVAPALGTPASGILTNCTGTAAGLTAGTVTTNANLTGVITSLGNATSVASQTGTGTTFVMSTSPTLVTPVIGAATGTSLSVSGQLASTIATGTAPLVVSSTTAVTNLNASLLLGSTWATPGTIGSGTPSTGAFTTISATTAIAVTSGGTGQGSYTDGQLLIGNTTGNTLSKATLTAGSGISITNGHGTITIAASGGTFGLTAQASSATQSVVAGNLYPLDCTSAGTATFPASATAGDVFGLAIFGTGGWTVNTNGLNYYGTSYSALTGSNEGLTLFYYTGASRGWIDL